MVVNTNAYAALIFDCDGVLVNSEVLIHEIELQFLAAIGLDYHKHDFARRFSGLTEPEFIRQVDLESEELLGRPIPADFQCTLNAAKVKAVDARLTVIPGARTLVSAWKKPKAVASSSSRKSLERKLSKFGMLEVFDGHVYSSESVCRSKPDPSIFLFAADKLRIDAKKCVVIEDSILGIQAAKSARMTAVGFTGGDHCPPDHEDALLDTGADLVVDRLFDLHAILGLEGN